MGLPRFLQGTLRDRVREEDVPRPAYALFGASLLARDRLQAAPRRIRASIAAGRSTRDRITTTAYQHAFEARDSAAALPGRVRRRWAKVRGLPADVGDRVIDLRDGASQRYEILADSGERAVTRWQAERILNERADRLARSVTPKAARATVSTRDAARRAAASPQAARARQAGRRAKQSAKTAWDEYIAAVDEAGARQWGEDAMGPSTTADSGR